MLPRLILLDADGVLWRGRQALPQAPAFVSAARAAGVRCAIISNNAGPDRMAYVEKCRRLGLDFSAEDIFSVNHLAGPYVARHHPRARTLVVGSEMLVSMMRKTVQVISADEWLAEHGAAGRLAVPDDLGLASKADFDLVLVGIDVNVNYLKLSLASAALQHGAQLLGANPDYSFPAQDGLMMPGNGSLVDLLARVSNVKPHFLGKPTLHLLEQVEEETGIGRSDMVMIGDRIETDIAMARAAGLQSYLLLTGVTSADQVADGLPGVTVAATLDEVRADLGF